MFNLIGRFFLTHSLYVSKHSTRSYYTVSGWGLPSPALILSDFLMVSFVNFSFQGLSSLWHACPDHWSKGCACSGLMGCAWAVSWLGCPHCDCTSGSSICGDLFCSWLRIVGQLACAHDTKAALSLFAGGEQCFPGSWLSLITKANALTPLPFSPSIAIKQSLQLIFYQFVVLFFHQTSTFKSGAWGSRLMLFSLRRPYCFPIWLLASWLLVPLFALPWCLHGCFILFPFFPSSALNLSYKVLSFSCSDLWDTSVIFLASLAH